MRSYTVRSHYQIFESDSIINNEKSKAARTGDISIKEVLGRTNSPLSFDRTTRPNSSSITVCVFVVAVTFLPSRCLAMLGTYTLIHTDYRNGFMKYATKYVP
jgi:hypothetical protein